MDLTGLELTEEQIAKITTLAAEETAGLLSQRDSLLDEKKEAARLKEEAERKAQEAAAKAAKAAGDLETYGANLKKLHAAELETAKARLAQRDEQILSSKRAALVADLAGEFVSPEAGKLMLSGLVSVTMGEDGTPTTVYKGLDGGTVATTADGFKEYLRATESFGAVLKAVDSGGARDGGKPQGGGAAGGSGDDYRANKVSALNDKFKKLGE